MSPPVEERVPFKTVKLGTDQYTTGVILVDCTGMSFEVSPNKDYLFEFFLIFRTVATTTGIALAVNGPTSPVAIVIMKEISTSLTAVAHQMSRAYNVVQATTGVDTDNADMVARVMGILRVGSTGGTLILRFASEVSGSEARIMAGSILRYREI